jgi:hypothetical protein
MKIFISWSGERSGHVAAALRNWIPDVFPLIEAWASSNDIVPGVRWANELAATLASANFGILCLTKENVRSSWILFEAGALARQLEVARVVPYLIDLRSTDLEYPLAQFQCAEASESGTRALMQSINKLQQTPYGEEKFNRSFRTWWPELSRLLDDSPTATDAVDNVRTEREILEELLNISRSQYRTNLRPVSSLAPHARSGRQGIRALIYWHEHGLTFEKARALSEVLEKNGIETVLAKHRDPAPPDGLFIGALVGAEDVRVVLANIPYDLRYVFRPDYPDALGGDGSGLTIGIGYMSSHYRKPLDTTTWPAALPDETLKALSDPNLSNADFQNLLRRLPSVPADRLPSPALDPVIQYTDPPKRGGDEY